MLIVPRSLDAPSPSVEALRLAALGRRVAASPALASILTDLAFGQARRDDVVALHAASTARVAATIGMPS